MSIHGIVKVPKKLTQHKNLLFYLASTTCFFYSPKKLWVFGYKDPILCLVPCENSGVGLVVLLGLLLGGGGGGGVLHDQAAQHLTDLGLQRFPACPLVLQCQAHEERHRSFVEFA